MNSFVVDKDTSDILIVGRDSAGNDLSKWSECAEYESIAEEGLVFDMSNQKKIDENIGNLYKEIKLRAS